jgi:tRNA(Ile)-lysidine synthase
LISTHITNFIKKYKLQNKTIIVGFSGGYDSLCLLNCLNDLKSELGLTLIAAHFNHNWRGEKAKQEQINCEKFCNSKHIEFFTETADINSKQNETVARELRYAFFERAKNKFNTNIVFTAHNYDDNAETLIYRIVKGTGLTGLKGIQEKRDNYYRPTYFVQIMMTQTMTLYTNEILLDTKYCHYLSLSIQM